MVTKYLKQDEISTILDQALRYHRANNLKRAAELYHEILDQEQYNVNALHLLGLIELHNKNYELAEKYINRAINLAPKYLVFYINLGIVLQRQKKYLQAEAIYNRALALNLEKDPDLYFNLGLVFAKQNKLTEAKLAYEQAIELSPTNIKAYNNLAGVMLELADIETAITYYHQAMTLEPKAYRAANNLGNIYFNYYGDIDKAILFYQRAVAVNVDFWEAKFNLANCYRLTNQQQRAIITFQTCLKQGKNNTLSWYYLGLTYQQIGQIEQAVAAYEEVIKTNPNFLPAISNLYYAKRKICDWKSLNELDNLLSQANQQNIGEDPYINILRTNNRHENYKIAKSWSNSLAYKMRGLNCHYKFTDLYNKKRIKIGYILNTLATNEIGIVKALLKTHDRTNFDVFVYIYGDLEQTQALTEVKQCADCFIELNKADYITAANKIHADEIQILIDLTGHARQNKMEILALKPAPVQISYLGFHGTSGAEFIDYIILDKVVLQNNELNDYSENIILMPYSLQVTDRWQNIAIEYTSKKQFGLNENQLIFSAMCQSEQIDQTIFTAWMRILKKVPNSVLFLYAEHEVTCANLKNIAAQAGIATERLQFVTRLNKEQHLSRLKIVDLALDSKSVNDYSATLDALWSGIPVITFYGDHYASRISASLLTAIGLPECITTNVEDYELCALEYALDLSKLAALKQRLQANRLKMPLFNTELLCRNLEMAYTKTWENYLSNTKTKLLEIN